MESPLVLGHPVIGPYSVTLRLCEDNYSKGMNWPQTYNTIYSTISLSNMHFSLSFPYPLTPITEGQPFPEIFSSMNKKSWTICDISRFLITTDNTYQHSYIAHINPYIKSAFVQRKDSNTILFLLCVCININCPDFYSFDRQSII